MNIKTSNPEERASVFPNRFVSMKKALRHRLTAEFRKSLPEALIRRALDEAEQLSASTDFPQLFFPALAEEQVRRIAVFAHPTHTAPGLKSAA
ncbi:MAG TPA: hypothetical protein VF614_16125 [Chthoniobacteraceae bacterium]|jgi:hypothetical protein